jgi:hypothetical protein
MRSQLWFQKSKKCGKKQTQHIQKKMILTTMRLLLSLLLAMGSMALGEDRCELEVYMFSNATINDCFGGWALQQATNLASTFLRSWTPKVYPEEQVKPPDECTGVKTLTSNEYNALNSDAKKVYRQSMRAWGSNTAYDLNFPYCKDQGYRAGFRIEYNDKLDSEDTASNDVVPVGAPSDEPPQEPGPKPKLVTTSNYTKWFVEGYRKGWILGCTEGYTAGFQDGKAAGNAALHSSTALNVVFTSAFQQKDDTCGQDNRNLRGGAQTNQDQSHRKLYGGAGYTCARSCFINQNRYNYCMVMGLCSPNSIYRRRHLQSAASSSSDSDEDGVAASAAWQSRFTERPVQGQRAGSDFLTLLATVVSARCNWEDVTAELWEKCPVSPPV